MMTAPDRVYDDAAHTYTIGARPADSVTYILWENGLIERRWYTEQARQRGKRVHFGCHLLDTPGGLNWDSIHPSEVGYVRSWELLKVRNQIEVVDSERQVWDDDNLLGGTLDRRVRIHRRNGIWVLDLKTIGDGSGHPPSWTELQVGAYERMSRRPGEPVARRAAVVLQADGSLPRIHEYPAGDSAWYEFLSLANATRTRRKHGRERKPERVIDAVAAGDGNPADWNL